jgi:tetratricopeptide (TPR) repeat protein
VTYPLKFIWVLLFAFGAYGCKGGADEAAAEATAGGETVESGVAVDARADDAPDDDARADATSPWGATQAEQCRRPAPPSIDGRAQRDIDAGVRAVESGDVGAATGEFESALQRDSNAYTAHYNLGVLADRGGDEKAALGHYRRALQALPDYEPAARGIATISLRHNRAQDALALVEPIANDYRTNLDIQALYAELLVHVKRYDEAWMAARRALKCDERFVPALVALVKVSRAQGRDELADSILDQALEIDPDRAELHYLDGERLRTEPGRLGEALAAYQRAVELRPDYAEARMALGIQMLAGGNYQEALAHFQAAAALVPTLPAAHVNLGDAYRATEQWTESQTAYRQALALQERLPEAHYGLGLLFLTAGGDFPGLDELSAYEKAVGEFQAYRTQMGARLSKDDQSEEYLRDLDRMIQRTRRRLEREQGESS